MLGYLGNVPLRASLGHQILIFPLVPFHLPVIAYFLDS
jgi:hypothetical protein